MSLQPDFQSHQGSNGFFDDYKLVEGVPDELLDVAGNVRPVWRELVGVLKSIDPDDMTHRISIGRQYLRDAGVFYRHYSAKNTTERDWPLSPIPLLLDETEWQSIREGLSQRADILESVMADLYGNNTLVRDGFLPARLVSQNPEWIRPLVGVKPKSGHFLHFVAFDIGRGPNGKWWVLGDRTQAPSGAGFALENRLATTRIFSGLYPQSHVHRIAGFFKSFRNAMLTLRGGDEQRAGILTPGPMNETYFEHAYIARYLGFMLLQGEDLTMRDSQLMVRTIDGFQPVNVLWRRMDSMWVDPLELEENSQLGTAGLLGAIRNQNVTMINAIGSGVLETRALLAFLPRIASEWAGRPLKMPNIATWWCGQPREKEYVKANADRMTIGSAYTTRFLFDLDDITVVGGKGDVDVHGSLDNWIDENADTLVGQEAVKLSTAPALEENRIVPRPMSLRVFLARTESGWVAMPGGFARIGRDSNSTELAMQRGGSAADVWIVSPKPVVEETMLPQPDEAFRRRAPGVLPSRAADNLFWLGRYVERTEHVVRLLRSYHLRVSEFDSHNSELIAYLKVYLEKMGVLDFDEQLPGFVTNLVNSAGYAAGQVSDRFSMDGTLALQDLSKTINQLAQSAKPGSDMARAMSVILRKLSGLSGLIHDNMSRFAGWRFLQIGKLLERAATTTRLVEALTSPAAPAGAWELAIEVADSAMTHRQRYDVATNRSTVIDLLALDLLNPRSIIYQFREIEEHIGYLPGSSEGQQLTPVRSTLVKAMAQLAVLSPDEIDQDRFPVLMRLIAQFSDDLNTAYVR